MDRLLESEKTLGSQRVTSGFSCGRQEQMIPTLISTEVHVAAGGLSYVGSGLLEMATSDWRRRIETMQTLIGHCQ